MSEGAHNALVAHTAIPMLWLRAKRKTSNVVNKINAAFWIDPKTYFEAVKIRSHGSSKDKGLVGFGVSHVEI